MVERTGYNAGLTLIPRSRQYDPQIAIFSLPKVSLILKKIYFSFCFTLINPTQMFFTVLIDKAEICSISHRSNFFFKDEIKQIKKTLYSYVI